MEGKGGAEGEVEKVGPQKGKEPKGSSYQLGKAKGRVLVGESTSGLKGSLRLGRGGG